MFIKLIGFLKCQSDKFMQMLADMLAVLNAILNGITELNANEYPDHISLELLDGVCVSVDDGEPTIAVPGITWDRKAGEPISKMWFTLTGDPITGTVVELDSCECYALADCDCGDTDTVENAFDLSEVDKSANTKFAFDSPSFTNAHGDAGTNNWTAADLVAALNSTAANATAAQNESGVDYTATTWAVHPTADAVVASGTNIPATLDLVSLSISLPVSTI